MENTRGELKKLESRLKAFMAGKTFCPKCTYAMTEGSPCLVCLETERKAQEAAQTQKRKDIERLGGLRAYEDYKENNLDSACYNASKAIEIAKTSPNLYIWGPRGTGKTHLAAIIARERKDGLIIKPQTIMRFLKEKVLDAKKEQEEVDFFVNHECLVIDDLGTEKLTPHTRSLLYEIIDGRWSNKRSGLIITSNLSPDELAAQLEDDRVTSRLMGMCRVIRLAGIDRRLTPKGEIK